MSALSSIRGLCETNGRAFAIGQQHVNNYLFEVDKRGNLTQWGAPLPADPRPQLCASQTEILILSGGLGYVFDLATNTLTPITAAGFPVGATKIGYLDGYFVALQANSQSFSLSGLNDGTSWDPLDFGSAEGEPGDMVSFVIDHRQVWFFGNTHAEIYYDSGAANFPLSRLEGAFMEQGCAAADSLVRCDNSVFWLGRNGSGGGVVWRANGYTPERVSNHAIEQMIQSYPRIDDAQAYSYQDGGHEFYVLSFPTADRTLVYDVASGMWHERGWWDASRGIYRRDRAACHMYAFGKHLAGDWMTGTLFEMTAGCYTDAGTPIRRLRSSPDLTSNGTFTRYGELRLFVEAGSGADGGAPGSDPQITLQSSDDGGFTWSDENPASLGKLGEYRKLVRWRRLGRSNNRAFRVICSEPVQFALISADVEASS
jgi:hypothetical protein